MTCTCTFRTQVSFSSVVEVCSVRLVRSAGWLVRRLFVPQLSVTCDGSICFENLLEFMYGGSHDLKK